MATAPLIIMDPVVASPAAFSAASHANDNTICWTQDPRAKLLLASCAADMPHGEWKRERFGWGGGQWFEYVGYRAEALERIREEHGQRVLDAYHAHGDPAYPLFQAWCVSPKVVDAIDAAAEAVLSLKMED
jgi:hypothetical protein